MTAHMADKPEFPLALRGAISEFKNWVHEQQIQDALPEDAPLHHYTSAAALEGILRSREMWFTDAFHLNDPSEIMHGLDVASECLRDSDVTEWADEIEKIVKQEKLFSYFVGSFCSEGDDLTQWRMYGDNARGFRLTVCPASFEGCVPCFTRGVEYGRTGIKAHCEDAIEKLREIANQEEIKAAVHPKIKFGDEMWWLLFSSFLGESIFAKNEAYKIEKEIRSILLGDREKLEISNIIQCRIRGATLVPYIPLKFRESGPAIIEIMAGPAAGESAVANVNHLLRQHGWDAEQIKVTQSPIPYRPV